MNGHRRAMATVGGTSTDTGDAMATVGDRGTDVGDAMDIRDAIGFGDAMCIGAGMGIGGSRHIADAMGIGGSRRSGATLVAMLLVLAAAAAGAGCTYGASFTDCAVACHAADQCPDGFACGQEGFCRAPASRGTCASVRGDAGLVGEDGASARCSGAAAACDTFVPMGDCLGQDGCTFTVSKCTLTTDCSAITTNQQCMATPGCATDIPTSTCKPQVGYCHGSTKPICEAIQSCAFSGGCAGTPRACSTYSDESGCRTQGGCDWR